MWRGGGVCVSLCGGLPHLQTPTTLPCTPLPRRGETPVPHGPIQAPPAVPPPDARGLLSPTRAGGSPVTLRAGPPPHTLLQGETPALPSPRTSSHCPEDTPPRAGSATPPPAPGQAGPRHSQGTLRMTQRLTPPSARQRQAATSGV